MAKRHKRNQDSFTDFADYKVNEQCAIQVRAKLYSAHEEKEMNTFTNYMKHDVRALIFDAITLEPWSCSIFLFPVRFLFINVSVEYWCAALFVSC